MFVKCVVIGVVVISIALKSVRSDDINAQNEIMDSTYSGDHMNYGKIDNIPRDGLFDNGYGPQPPTESWLETARNAMSGPAGQIIVSMAKEMISRSTGNSQLIFAAGLIGAGNWGQYGRARNYDSSLIRADEAPLFIGYLALEGSGQDGCLNQAACKAPDTAKEYLKAAMAVIKGTEMFDQQFFNSTRNYSYALNQMEHSIRRGIEGAPCDSIYHCHL